MARLATALPLALLALAPVARAQDLSDWRDVGVCYEVFVRSFQDSDGDGVGDLRGLIERLDYISDGDPATTGDLGARCIWLMPIAPSPSYHGYDVTNYYEINPDYGSSEDFRELVAEAHRRGIAVIVDLVLNHSSSEHPFFKSALLDPQSPYRDWYTWSPEPLPMPGWSQPTWHRVPGREEYYYGLFWSGMPDLNLANPEVVAEAERITRFWLDEMGVDGFRLDAVSHFFEADGQWRHVPAVHPWLRDYATSVRTMSPDAFTVGEVWDSTGAILPYYPDQLEAYFIFEVADAIVDAVRAGTAAHLIAAVSRAQQDLPAGRWASFLRNHDQTRTLTDLNGDVERAKLAATLLLTLPGLPFIYYGEEIGMTGSKSDGDPRLRTPMHWTLDRAAGFTDGLPWEPLRPDSFTANVHVQEDDPGSLLNHYRRLIHLRGAHPALGSGDFVPLATGSDGVVAWLRRSQTEAVAVVANLTDRRITGLDVASSGGVLEPGTYSVRRLLDDDPVTGSYSSDGRVGLPLRELEPFEVRIVRFAR